MEVTRENIKRVWLENNAICIETNDGNIGREYFADYQSLKNASAEKRGRYTLSKYGIRWAELDEDLSFEGFFKAKPAPNEMAKVFKNLHSINISAFARRVGIPQPLMAAYLNGAKKPSRERKKEIEEELHKLGRELMEAHI